MAELEAAHKANEERILKRHLDGFNTLAQAAETIKTDISTPHQNPTPMLFKLVKERESQRVLGRLMIWIDQRTSKKRISGEIIPPKVKTGLTLTPTEQALLAIDIFEDIIVYLKRIAPFSTGDLEYGRIKLSHAKKLKPFVAQIQELKGLFNDINVALTGVTKGEIRPSTQQPERTKLQKLLPTLTQNVKSLGPVEFST